jgi:hypothetical protein
MLMVETYCNTYHLKILWLQALVNIGECDKVLTENNPLTDGWWYWGGRHRCVALDLEFRINGFVHSFTSDIMYTIFVAKITKNVVSLALDFDVFQILGCIPNMVFPLLQSNM